MFDSNAMQVNRQWSTRPDDERFTSLHELQAVAAKAKNLSRAGVMSNRQLRFQPVADDATYKGLEVVSQTGNVVAPTHWAFSQLAQKAGFRANDIRRLPSPLAADVMNYGLGVDSDIDDIGVLIGLDDNGKPETLRAATGPKYGRVWNAAIADSLVRMFGDGVTGTWKVPGEWGNPLAKVTKDNTTIYGSDRDMFVFLCDEENRIDMKNRRDGKAGSLARGFIVWNSEVGSMSFGMAAFLFDFVCGNRIIWGLKEYRESRFRHTASAPDKWIEKVSPMLAEYAKSSATPYESAIAAAQSAKVDKLAEFMASRFTQKQAAAIADAHNLEENRPMESLWDIATGITAYAKTIPFQNERVLVEREAGKVLDLVAA